MTDAVGTEQQNIAKQKYLGKTGLICFIMMANMFVPFSVDLYLPALPGMSNYFGVSGTLANLTLSVFFLCMAVGNFFWGPISDKYGRRTVLIISSSLYSLASFVCSLAPSVYVLIGARICQGLVASGITTTSTAMVKDCFGGQEREKILALVQTIFGIAPMVAPVVGAFLLNFTDWRGDFRLLTFVGLLCLVISIFYVETLPEQERYTGSIFGSVGELFKVLRNVSFVVPCLIFAMYQFSFMAYLSMSAYIYEDYFGMSEQMYSYFYAINAGITTIGPMIYVKFFINSNKQKFAIWCFLVYIFSGAFLLMFGCRSAILFLIGFAPFSLVGMVSRPFSTNIILNQQDGNTGSAAAILSGTTTIVGSIGMTIISLFPNTILAMGGTILITGFISIMAWTMLMKSSIPCRGVK